MVVLLIITLVFQLTGLICIWTGFRLRDKEHTFISFENPINPWRWKENFRNPTGWRLAVAGGFLLSLGGLIEFVYFFAT